MYLGDDGPAGPRVRTGGRAASCNPYRRSVHQARRRPGAGLRPSGFWADKAALAIRSVTIPPTTPTRSGSTRSIRPRPAMVCAEQTLHAYVGARAELLQGRCPEHVKSVTSLGSFLVLSFNAASARFASADARCAAARGIVAGLREANDGRLRLPPLSGDALSRRLPAPSRSHRGCRRRPRRSCCGDRAQGAAPRDAGRDDHRASLAPRRRCRGIVIEEVPVEDLLASAEVRFDGWSGPPWIREGWFHAYRLLAPGLEAAEREAVEQAYQPLIRGQTRSIAEHADLERRLVGRARRSLPAPRRGLRAAEEFSTTGIRRESRMSPTMR